MGWIKLKIISQIFDSSVADHKSSIETKIILQQYQYQPQFQVHPIMENPPTIMDLIITARYAPLVLPQNLNYFPARGYQNYLPKYNSEREVTAEEHLESFYSFADNHNVENSMCG